MADVIEIVQGTATVVEVAGPTGPQGPAGAAGATGAQGPQGAPGTGLEVLTTQGDLLYQGGATGERLPIGTAGQVLKVVTGEPAWANESGAVVSVNGETGTVVLDAADLGAAPATGIDPTAITGTAVVDNDARLSDTRDPNAHAASHAAAGSDPVFDQDLNEGDSPTFNQVTINDVENDASTLALSNSGGANAIEFAAQELTLRHTGTNNTPYINVTDGTDYALLGVRQGDMFLQGSNAVVRIEQGGGDLADIKVNKLVVEDATTAGDPTATFDADGNLTDNRTYDLPDASGTLALTSDIPALGTGAGEAAEGDHTHELDALDATGATNGHVLTAQGDGTAAFEAAGGGDEIADDLFRVIGSADATKKVAFEVDGLTTATTRTLTVPNASGRLQVEGQPIGNTTPAAGTFTTLAATGTTELVNGVTAAGPFRVYNTSSASNANHERGFMRWSSNVLQIGTEAAGTGSNRSLELWVAGQSRISFSTGGGLATFNSSITMQVAGGSIACSDGLIRCGSTRAYEFGTRSRMTSPADGQIRLTNTAEADFDRLQFGGTTSSFPALKRSTTVLQARLADDTAFAPLQGQLRTHQNAVAETPTATHTMTLFDAAGTAYRVLCVV